MHFIRFPIRMKTSVGKKEFNQKTKQTTQIAEDTITIELWEVDTRCRASTAAEAAAGPQSRRRTLLRLRGRVAAAPVAWAPASAAVPAARAGRVIRGFSVFNACFFALCTVYERYRRRRAIARGPVRVARSRGPPSRLTSRDRSTKDVCMTSRDSSVSRGTRRARGTRTGPSRARPRATKIARASGRGATRASR